jgi:hypothetical protein
LTYLTVLHLARPSQLLASVRRDGAMSRPKKKLVKPEIATKLIEILTSGASSHNPLNLWYNCSK